MKKKTLFVLSLLSGLMFINAGLNIFLPHARGLHVNVCCYDADQLADAPIRTAHVLGGVMFIIPRFRAWAAVIICLVMAGLMLNHLFVAPEGLPIALPLFAILVWAIVENREKFLPMIRWK